VTIALADILGNKTGEDYAKTGWLGTKGAEDPFDSSLQGAPPVGMVSLQQLDSGPYRVLLVEDELFVRMDIAATLRHAGFQVIEAACADAAMEFIESGEPIDLVFTDVQTPGMLDGLALAERVRAKYPLMPVFICSGNPELEGAASQMGKFVPKPYEPTGIVRLLTSSMR
jgi:two-component system, response regulator PdtaR